MGYALVQNVKFKNAALFICVSLFLPASKAIPIYNPSNGHYYDTVTPLDGISWTDSRSAADKLTFLGFKGHLATITSEAENDFILSAFPFAGEGYWLGGFQDINGAEPADGWQWITGELFSYTRWHPGEPNEFDTLGRPEDYLQFHAFIPGNPAGVWNDFINVEQRGFIVEFQPTAVPDSGGISLIAFSLVTMVFTSSRLKRNSPVLNML